jgi:hypothetical protein
MPEFAASGSLVGQTFLSAILPVMRKGPDPLWIEGLAERMLNDACVSTSEPFFIGPREREDPLQEVVSGPARGALRLSAAACSPMSSLLEAPASGQEERRRQKGRST